MIRTRLIVGLLSGVFVAATAGQPARTSATYVRSGLRAIEAGTGQLPFLLLHGYGSSAAAWMPFTFTIRLPANRRFVMPEGPETTVPPDGPPNGHAWWRLGLDAHRRTSDGLPDLARTIPPGLAASDRRVRTLLDELAARGRYSRERQMLAGFSQGGIVAADIAFTTDEPMEALVLMSTTFVNETAWRTGMPRRRGLRVFISHGRADDTLPFDVAVRLQQAMRESGLQVTWFPFAGGHEIPAEVVTALNAFLARPVAD
jgi:phospholipase/carboxylesterase